MEGPGTLPGRRMDAPVKPEHDGGESPRPGQATAQPER